MHLITIATILLSNSASISAQIAPKIKFVVIALLAMTIFVANMPWVRYAT